MRHVICDLSMRGPLAGVSVSPVAVRIPTPYRRAVVAAAAPVRAGMHARHAVQLAVRPAVR
eukprot:scaffold79071_cov121-Phaeocystis_antarctica.AAC.3